MKAHGTYTDGDLTAAIALNRSARVGIVGFRALMRHFGGGEKVLTASETALAQVRGIGPVTARKIAEARHKIDVQQEIEQARAAGAAIVPLWSDGYPRMLKEIFDPPLVLYVKGNLARCAGPAVAIVGSRRTSFYGRNQAERLARDLAVRGIAVVSGLARGIDTAAHQGTLAAGGRTVAVLGSGLAEMYPPENRKLADQIAETGAVITEFSMETRGATWTFPRRNRIISGMSLGSVVVEAGKRSGALITARCAIEQGREVFAVPGKVDNPLAHGVHGLIRDGVKLVETVEDILEELGPLTTFEKTVAAGDPEPANGAPISESEAAILGLLSSEPLALEAIAEQSGLEIPAVSSALTILEIERRIKQLPGKTYVKV